MILIDRNETDPYFNIAAEEYVLKEMNEDVFMLWISQPSVIIGKHQVAAAEADMIYVHRNNIPVIRRISGGGTVYHDEGNLNYSLIMKGEKGSLVDYEKYSGPVIRALAKHGIKAVLEGKSNLVTGGLKFSGNAEHVYHNKVLHHGTLLFSTDIQSLRNCLRPDHRDYVHRSIRSNDSNITNLSDHLPWEVNIRHLRDLLIRQIREDYPEIREYSFQEKDIRMIRELANNKYKTKEWNFSYSPRYELHKEINIGDQRYKLEIKTEKGYIKEMRFHDHKSPAMEALALHLTNILHHPEAIGKALQKISLESFFDYRFKEDFINVLF